jgi:hypothetical protein
MSLSEPKASLGEWGEGFGPLRKTTNVVPSPASAEPLTLHL